MDKIPRDRNSSPPDLPTSHPSYYARPHSNPYSYSYTYSHSYSYPASTPQPQLHPTIPNFPHSILNSYTQPANSYNDTRSIHTPNPTEYVRWDNTEQSYVNSGSNFGFCPAPTPVPTLPPINYYASDEDVNPIRVQADQSLIESLNATADDPLVIKMYAPTHHPNFYNLLHPSTSVPSQNVHPSPLPPSIPLPAPSIQVPTCEHQINTTSANVLNLPPIYSSDTQSRAPFPPIDIASIYGVYPPPAKVYYCLKCNQTFGRKNSLRRHEKLHTGIKHFHCGVCNKWFSRRDILLRHHGSKKCMARTSAQQALMNQNILPPILENDAPEKKEDDKEDADEKDS